MHKCRPANQASATAIKIRARAAKLLAIAAALLLGACGGSSSGGDTPPTPPAAKPAAQTYTVAGSISGLSTDGLVLRNNGADDLTLAANTTTFRFSTPIAAGGGYSVTAFTQPTGLTCTINNGTGSNITTNVTNVHIVCSATTFTVGGSISGLTTSGLVLQNNAGDNLMIAANASAFEFATPIAYGSGYAVTILTQPSGQSCSLTNATGNNATNPIHNVAVSCAQTALTTSVSSLALAVNCPAAGGSCVYTNAALTGNARTIAITNASSTDTTTALTVTPTSFPTGTSITDHCTGLTLTPLSSCAITITPGEVATSGCTSGITPTPATVAVNASSAPSAVVTNIAVLSYGCIYQGGFIYSIDDTTPITSSIGGKVVAQTDQAAPYINSGPQVTSIIWSSNGAGSASSDVSSDMIPGIDETSTSGAGSPTFANAQTTFNSTYSNTGIFPFPSSGSFSSCNGGTDGACNSANIFALYGALITNFSTACDPNSSGSGCVLSSGITAPTDYAAGLCSATIGGYSDWYLPAACEMGPDSNGSGCAAGEQNMLDNLAFLIGDPAASVPSTSCSPPSGADCLAGYYWSSTAYSLNPQFAAWSQYFSFGGGGTQIPNAKSALQGARCARALTH